MTWIRLIAAVLGMAATAPAGDRELIVCGWDEVFILDVSDAGPAPRKVWSWRAADRPELPASYHSRFRTTDECKLVAGNRILITASSDGVALVDRATGKASFWGQCANAHSAEMLPGERIAVACSVCESGGNRLAVFDASTPEKEVFSTELYSGHGAVWDPGRKLLWALGGRELRAYSVTGRELHTESAYPLPDPGGHELTAVPGSPLLAVTTGRSAWLFHREARTFAPHPELRGREGVKSISIHPQTGQIAYVQADPPEWWSDKIRLLNPNRTIHLPGQRLYKARWAR